MCLLNELLKQNFIIMSLKGNNKEEILRELTDRFYEKGLIEDKNSLFNTLIERENIATTGLGRHVGLPHARTNAVSKLHLVFARSEKGVDFKSLDKKKVFLFFLFVGPDDKNEEYIKILAKLSRLIRIKEVRESLISAKNEDEVLDIIKNNE
ncbi:hypothetical protein DRP43_02385 [candidate division TA06 bacterium]|uniref:PTS EIIA type-2 domain-containing protein n=1 Tax=candidate division TA06 bacterium TaxID=2250710 RepID=A0A660SNB5_UNCT6|nr:MAG: hypothetical protein DRP43_02385 [candidate division TA06 bacterium]